MYGYWGYYSGIILLGAKEVILPAAAVAGTIGGTMGGATAAAAENHLSTFNIENIQHSLKTLL